MKMSNSSVSFGSTTILYKGNKTPLYKYVDKLLKSGKFSEVKRVDTLAAADSRLKPGQVGLFLEKQGVTLTGKNAAEDKLIYDILTNNGKSRLPGSSYVTDHVDVIV